VDADPCIGAGKGVHDVADDRGLASEDDDAVATVLADVPASAVGSRPDPENVLDPVVADDGVDELSAVAVHRDPGGKKLDMAAGDGHVVSADEDSAAGWPGIGDEPVWIDQSQPVGDGPGCPHGEGRLGLDALLKVQSSVPGQAEPPSDGESAGETKCAPAGKDHGAAFDGCVEYTLDGLGVVGAAVTDRPVVRDADERPVVRDRRCVIGCGVAGTRALRQDGAGERRHGREGHLPPVHRCGLAGSGYGKEFGCTL
jgi:hypothetical protein